MKIWILKIVAALLLGIVSPVVAATDHGSITEIRAEIMRSGSASVIVEMELPQSPSERTQDLSPTLESAPTATERTAEVARMQSNISEAAQSLSVALAAATIAMEQTYENLPVFVTTVDANKLERLMVLPQVKSISLNRLNRPEQRTTETKERLLSAPEIHNAPPDAAAARAEEIELGRQQDMHTNRYINAEAAWGMGFTGSGQVVAVLDTGIEASHPVFAGKIVAEACFSTVLSPLETSLCPNNASSQIGTGAARNCGVAGSCAHGSHVSSTAIGGLGNFDPGAHIKGVAPDARLIPIQVFTLFRDIAVCDGESECLRSYTSSQLGALNYIISLTFQFNVAAVNMSLGGSAQSGACDSDPRKTPIDTLRNLGTLTTISAGNEGLLGKVSSPGCISTAITVSSVNHTVPHSAVNHAPNVDVLAPGVGVFGAAANNSFSQKSGTSMAAPHVAGAIALLRSASPRATATQIETALKTSGIPTDYIGWTWKTPRVDVTAAVTALTAPRGTPIASVLPSNNSRAMSLLRLYNPTRVAGQVTVEVYNNKTGIKLGTWMKNIPAYASLQIYLSEIEKNATPRITPAAGDSYSLYVDAPFEGFVQHVMYNPQGPFLTNVSSCESGLSASGDRYLGNIHTSNIKGYPSYILLHNKGAAAVKPSFKVYHSLSGELLGGFVTRDAVLPYTSALIYASDLVEFFGKQPTIEQGHINVVLDVGFNGFAQHIMDNQLSGMYVNMTSKCDM